MTIRKARKSDCRACERLSQKCKELANVNGRADYYRWFVEFLKAGQILVVAEERGAIVGFVAGEVNTGYALMQLLAVGEKSRGSGVGKKLVEAFEKECLKRKIIHVLLYGHENRSRFFEDRGYGKGAACHEFMKILTP